MYKGKTILGIIPARGGSKGLPKKNILPLLEKPLIVWTIEQGHKSKYLDKVIISTDDDEIAEISRNFGADVPFKRPAELATDNSKTIDVISHTTSFFAKKGEFFDYVALLEPTSPLRRKSDIDKSIEYIIDNKNRADSLVSVGEIALEHPHIVKILDKEGYVKPFIPAEKTISRRQELPKAYFPYGVIYISKTSSLLKSKTFYQERTLSYLIERWQNYEIDDKWDLLCIEAVLKFKMQEENKI